MEIGEKLTEFLENIEMAILNHEVFVGTPPGFTDEGFRSIVHIFSSALMDRVWRLQENENMSFEDRAAMVEALGDELRHLIKVYTNVDTHNLFE